MLRKRRRSKHRSIQQSMTRCVQKRILQPKRLVLPMTVEKLIQLQLLQRLVPTSSSTELKCCQASSGGRKTILQVTPQVRVDSGGTDNKITHSLTHEWKVLNTNM